MPAAMAPSPPPQSAAPPQRRRRLRVISVSPRGEPAKRRGGTSRISRSSRKYVAWTPLGAGFVEGLQGRYFLPLAPAAALLLYNRRLAGRWPAGPGAGRRFGAVSLAFTVLTLLCIWFRYYGDPRP